jgi:Rps23 Pro-64 3,4-dihydroxylase Tpa1-like proline 4-hydroxylase
LSQFLRDEAEFSPEFGLYATGDEAATEAAWLNANEEDRFFRLSKLVGASPRFKLSANMLTYLQFRKAFQLPDFREFFQKISGMPLGWSDDFGAHSMKPGDFLRGHSDDNRNRSLALVIYLSPGWDPRFGGALNVVDMEGRRTIIEAEYNSMVLFDVAAGTTHYVDSIYPIEDRVERLTIGGWYHKPD